MNTAKLHHKALLPLTSRIEDPLDLTKHFPFMIAVVTNLLQLSKDASIRKIANLEPREFRVLLNIGSYMPIKAADIAYLGRLDSYTVSRAVKVLRQGDLIEVVATENNKKIKNLVLTQQGEKIYREICDRLNKRTQELESVITIEEKIELLRLLSLLERKSESMIACNAMQELVAGNDISADQKEIVRWFKKSAKATRVET
ncbi:MAG: MarR family transcriptional regulator [Kangiellaceae bacterium]|nr:MarR family transcriptional regulator [Kangiellaceae bacterium]